MANFSITLLALNKMNKTSLSKDLLTVCHKFKNIQSDKMISVKKFVHKNGFKPQSTSAPVV